MKKNKLKLLGIIVTVIGAGTTLISSWIDDKRSDQIMDEKIANALEIALKRDCMEQ